MERAEQEFSKKFTEYIDGQKSFPENIMLKRQKELQLLMEQSLNFKKEAEELLTKAEAELMAPIHNTVKEAINEVGKEHKYAYVLNTDANAYPYISGNGEAENCTDAVLTRLGIK
jgi:outer membrane protein